MMEVSNTFWIAALLLAGLAGTGLLGWRIVRERARASRYAARLRALAEFSRRASAGPEPQQLFDTAVQAVHQTMGYGAARLHLYDEDRKELSLAASSSPPDLAALSAARPLGQDLAGLAVRSGQTQRRPDLTRHPGLVHAPGGGPPLSALSIPLRSADRLAGVLEVLDRRKSAFDEDDVRALESLAEQLGVSLGKARLFEAERRRAQRIATINHIGRLITSSLSMDELLATAVEAVNTYLHYSDIALLLVDPAQPDTLVLSAKSGVYLAAVPGEYRQPIHQGVIGRAVRGRKPVLINDVRADPDYIPIPGAELIRAELAVPIQIGGRVLGALNIESEHPFSVDDATECAIIADQLATAIDNAQLFAATEADLARLATLYALGQRISQARDGHEVMRSALEELAARGKYRCTLALLEFDPAGQATGFHVPFYYQPGEGVCAVDMHVPTSDDDLNPLLDGGQTVAIVDVATDARVPDGLRRDQLASGRPALALIPLVVGGRRIGNLVLSHTEPHFWTEAELQLFRSSANQIASAIENARRYEREKERTERLALIARIGQRIAARLDPDELLNTTVEVLHGHLGYDHVTIFLVDLEDPGWLLQRACASRWHYAQSPKYRQPLELGIMGKAARQRTPELVNDVPGYLRVGSEANIRAELAVPILHGERLLGVLDVASEQLFRADDVTSLSIVAEQLAVALENASLYERAQEAGVLEARQRLARDLHDSVTQLIFSITLIAQSIQSAYRRDPVEGERRIGRLLELSQQSLAEMRALLAEMRPEHLLKDGLLLALHKQFERISAREKLAIELAADTYAPQTPDSEEALYRIVQEALNNVVKHAAARQVKVRLAQVDGAVELSIGDDGCGFDPARSYARGRVTGGVGLSGMRERVEQLGGVLEIHSRPEAGTLIRAVLPARPMLHTQ
jgi:GAF domain-containing protein